MIHCSLLLSLAVAAVYQTVMEEVRMDSIMGVYKCTIIVLGRLNFFSCCRKNILYSAFLMRDLMFSCHFRSWVMMVPRMQQDSTESTGEPHRMTGVGGAGFFWLHQVTRWSLPHL